VAKERDRECRHGTAGARHEPALCSVCSWGLAYVPNHRRVMDGREGDIIAAVYLQHGYTVERFAAPRVEPANPSKSCGNPFKWNAPRGRT